MDTLVLYSQDEPSPLSSVFVSSRLSCRLSLLEWILFLSIDSLLDEIFAANLLLVEYFPRTGLTFSLDEFF